MGALLVLFAVSLGQDLFVQTGCGKTSWVNQWPHRTCWKSVQQAYGVDGLVWLQSVEGGKNQTSSLPTLYPDLLPNHISIEETRPLILSHWQFCTVEGVGWDFSWKLPDPDRFELNAKQLARFQSGCSILLQLLIIGENKSRWGGGNMCLQNPL